MAIWALVTGASEGLGREFATLAAKDGFDVILTARQTDKLETHARALRRAYNRRRRYGRAPVNTARSACW
jgi:uncharacterized protein